MTTVPDKIVQIYLDGHTPLLARVTHRDFIFLTLLERGLAANRSTFAPHFAVTVVEDAAEEEGRYSTKVVPLSKGRENPSSKA